MNRVLIAFVLFALAAGCKGAAPAVSAKDSPATSSTNETVAHIHWLGKKNISAGTNALGLMQLWNLPESAKLEAQTLDKLSLAPWRLLPAETNRISTGALRPLLDDLLQEESYLEIRHSADATNQPGEMVLAIRLKPERAAQWRTNLAAALESLTGIKPDNTEHGLPRRSEAKAGTQNTGRLWALKKHHAPNLIELARSGEWTLLGSAQDHNSLLDETLARIQRNRLPFATTGTNFWLDAGIDLHRSLTALGRHLDLPANFPKISLTVVGAGTNVLTRAQLTFPEPLSFTLDQWNIPTNFVDAYLSSFTAIRGCQSLLTSIGWNKLESNFPPNQLYIWAIDGPPMQTYFAAPLPDASNTVSKLSDSILRQGGPWFAAHDLAQFQRAKTFNGLEWKGAPFISAFFKSVDATNDAFMLGGFFPPGKLAGPPPQLIHTIQGSTNLVYYDWELTGLRTEQLNYLAQFLRLILGRDQFPSDSLAMIWLKSMTQRLGPSTSRIDRTGPQQFTFARSSSLPFTAIELHLLAEWLQSPEFPAIEAFRADDKSN